MIKKVNFFIFILVSHFAYSQDEGESGGDGHRMYVTAVAGGFHASKKTASYYNGEGENSISRLLSIQQIYDQIYNKIGSDYRIGGYPQAMRYKIGVDLGIETGIWVSEFTALTLGMEYVNLKVSDAFTLEVDNPANPFGDPLIYPEQINAVEQRFQLNLGLHHDVGSNYQFMTFFEWGINFNAMKTIKHEIIVEETLHYNLRYQVNQFTSLNNNGVGYGGFMSLGCRLNFQGNIAVDVGIKTYLQRVKISDFQAFAFSELLFMRIVYL